MSLTRRSLLAASAALLVPKAARAATITDTAGRIITVPETVARVPSGTAGSDHALHPGAGSAAWLAPCQSGG